MAPRVTEPASDEEIEALREAIEEQRHEVREALAEDLGGEPADYDVEQYFAEHAAER